MSMLRVTYVNKCSLQFCGRKFNKRANMIAHFASHSTDKKYECAECSFKTAYKNSLIIHIRKHSGDRPFTCDICGYTSNSGSNLYTHRRQHTGEKYNASYLIIMYLNICYDLISFFFIFSV